MLIPFNLKKEMANNGKNYKVNGIDFLALKYLVSFKHEIFFFISLLEYNCFTMLCQFLLYNEVNQLYVYIYPHIPSLLSLSPTLLSHPSRSSQSIKLISLCYTAASHQLSILHLVVYIRRCYSFTSSQLPHPPHPCPQVHSLCLRLYSCPAPRFIRTFFFFLDSIYMCQHAVFVFLFLTYFTLYDRLQVHPPHYK